MPLTDSEIRLRLLELANEHCWTDAVLRAAVGFVLFGTSMTAPQPAESEA